MKISSLATKKPKAPIAMSKTTKTKNNYTPFESLKVVASSGVFDLDAVDELLAVRFFHRGAVSAVEVGLVVGEKNTVPGTPLLVGMPAYENQVSQVGVLAQHTAHLPHAIYQVLEVFGLDEEGDKCVVVELSLLFAQTQQHGGVEGVVGALAGPVVGAVAVDAQSA